MRIVALALYYHRKPNSFIIRRQQDDIGGKDIPDQDESIERLPKDLRPVVALAGIYGSAFKHKGSRGQMAALLRSAAE